MWNWLYTVNHPNQKLDIYLKRNVEGSLVILESGNEGEDGFMRLSFSPDNAKGMARAILKLLDEEV